jgi:hypothetical protein
MKLLLGVVLISLSSLWAGSSPLYLSKIPNFQTKQAQVLSPLNLKAKEKQNHLDGLLPWMRWGGLGLLLVGATVYIQSEDQLAQSLGVASSGLGIASFVWSFRL